MKKTASHLRLAAVAGAAFLLILAACAEYAPVPGGTDTVNAGFYPTKDDFLARINGITRGTPEKEVLAKLGHQESEMIRLKRDEIMTALLGTNTLMFRDDAEQEAVLKSLYGYRLNYKIVERKHGFSSPIRIRTDEVGFNYTVTLIFRKGMLYEEPIVTGGEVNASSSKTFFDFLSPGTLMGK